MSNSSAFNSVLFGALFAAFLAFTASASAQSVSADRVQGSPTKPLRAKRLTPPPKAPRYKCEDGECVCKGMLDCKSLIDSGFCKGKEFWQDKEDSSVGGCG